MRTKNAKRLWPVPVTVTVMALAAFLAFGLFATTGAQPTEAQADPDCKITVTKDTGTAMASIAPAEAADCETIGDTATIRFTGPARAPGADEKPIVLYVLAKNTRGDLKYYVPTTVYQANDYDGNGMSADIRDKGFYLTDNTAAGEIYRTMAESAKYSSHKVEVPLAEEVGGLFKAQTFDLDIRVAGSFRVYTQREFGNGYGTAIECRFFDGVFQTSGPEFNANCAEGAVPGGARILPAADDVTIDGSTVVEVQEVEVASLGRPNKEKSTIKVTTVGVDGPEEAISGDADTYEMYKTFVTMDAALGDAILNGRKREFQISANESEVQFEIIIRDDNVTKSDVEGKTDGVTMYGSPLAGGKLEVEVTFDDGSMVERGVYSYSGAFPSGKAQVVKTGTPITVDGWSDAPARATVEITYVVGAYTLELDPIVVAIPGPPTDIVASTNICEEVTNLKLGQENTEDGCPENNEVPMEEDLFQPGEVVVIKAKVVDALGTSLGVDDLNWEEMIAEGADGSIEGAVSGDDFPHEATLKAKADITPGMYSITVSHDDGDDDTDVADVMFAITVAGELASYNIAGADRIVPGAIQEFTLQKLDDGGNLTRDDEDVSIVISGSSEDSVQALDLTVGQLTKDESESFRIYALPDASSGVIIITALGKTGIDPVSKTVMISDPPVKPGMPMSVMAEATSHDMITVSWESPDGVSAVTGYVLQSKTGTMDFMTIAASSAEVWWNTLDCSMMNAEIPDDATPAPPADDTDLTSPYCEMYAGLSAEATTVVDDVFADEYDTISGTSYSDMGLMAETTYYYRVSAINSAGKGEYSDGMAMATTMMATMMDELGTAMGVAFGFNEGGALQVSWTKAANAAGYIIIAVNTDDVNNDVVVATTNDGDDETWNMSGLTRGATYQVYVAATGSGVDEEGNAKFTLSAQAEVTIR